MSVKGHGVVVFEPLGGNFAIRSETSQYGPPDGADAASNKCYEWLADLNEGHGWEITTHHIIGNVPIGEVSWSGEDEYHVSYEWELPESLSMDWYSRSRLHEWNDPW